MASWPILNDLQTQMQAGTLTGPKATVATAALEAASEWIAERCGLDRAVEPIPAPVRQAILLYAAKFYGRKDSPHGIAGNPETGIIRTGRFDSDAESLLAPYLALPGIA